MANKLSSYATGLSGENLKILETDGLDATKANIRVQVAGNNVPDSQALPVKPTRGYDGPSDSFKYLPYSYYSRFWNPRAISNGVEDPGVVIVATGLKRVFVMASGDHIFDLYSYPSPDGSKWMDKEIIGSAIPITSSGVCLEVSKLAPYLKLTIKNVDTASGNFYLWVYGI